MNKNALIGMIVIADLLAGVVFIFALARQNGDGDPFSNPLIYVALALFIITPLILVVFFRQNSSGSDARLLQTGQPALATVLEVWNIRLGTKNGLAQVGLKLRVAPPSDSAYETKTTATVSPLQPGQYRAGMILHVRYDPRNPKRVVVDDGSAAAPAAPVAPQPATYQVSGPVVVNSPSAFTLDSIQADLAAFNVSPQIQKLVLSALVDEDHNGIPDILEKGGTVNTGNVQVINLRGSDGQPADLQTRIAKLEHLRVSGLLNDNQFEILRGMLEKKMKNG
jgi:hypothetical protein